jgi:GT2 family glycosyltransferase
MSRVAVVVVTFDGAAWIERCLGSIESRRHELFVIVVDNASRDGTAALVRQRFPHVRLVERHENVGFGRGNNEGMALALADGADHVFLLNQDAWCAQGAIDTLADFLDREPGYGVASPLHCTGSLDALDPRTTANYLRPYAMEYLSDLALGRLVRESYRVRGMNAAAWMIRADTLRRFGGFDPVFFMYAEDDDLLDRWERHNVPFALVPEARIGHARQSTHRKAPRWTERVRAKALRIESLRVLEIKRVCTSGRFGVGWLLSNSIAESLNQVLECRSPSSALAQLLATATALNKRAEIRAHAELCLTEGCHFISTKPDVSVDCNQRHSGAT